MGPYVRMSVCPYVRMSVCPYVRIFFRGPYGKKIVLKT